MGSVAIETPLECATFEANQVVLWCDLKLCCWYVVIGSLDKVSCVGQFHACLLLACNYLVRVTKLYVVGYCLYWTWRWVDMVSL